MYLIINEAHMNEATDRYGTDVYYREGLGNIFLDGGTWRLYNVYQGGYIYLWQPLKTPVQTR